MENSIVPPNGNTGVQSYNIDYKFGFFHPEAEISYSIDWLRITTGKIEYGEDQEPKTTSIPLINDLLKVLKSNYNYFDLVIESGGYYGFRSKMIVCDGIQINYYGPPNKKGDITTMIELSGTGCDRFKSIFDWYFLIKFLIEELNCNCSRIDEAIDDFYGKKISMNDFLDTCKDGFFIRSGSPKNKPKWIINNWKNYDDGCTIEFYSPTSSIQLVSYNKMAEQIAKNNPISDTVQWLRHEMRFFDEQANNQLRVFYDCLCFEVMGQISENSTAFSKYVSSALYECLKLYKSCNDSNKSRWIEHPGWKAFIGDISGIKFKRSKTKNDKILKTKIYFEDSYSRFLLKMYLVFGKEYFNLWIKDFLFNNRKKLDPEDYVNINELRHELGMKTLRIDEILIKAAEMQLLSDEDLKIINQYDLPNKQDFIKDELGQVIHADKKKLVDIGNEIQDERKRIIKKIEQLQALLGDDNE